MTGLGPFDLTGGPFLTLYCALFALAIVAGFAIPRWLRPEGHPGAAADPGRLGFLAGGADRYGEAVVSRLLACGAMTLDGKRNLVIRFRGEGRSPAESAVLALPEPIRWADVGRALKDGALSTERELVDRGLLIDRASAWQLRAWQTAPYLLLVLFGAIKWEIGTLRDKPVGILTVLLVVTAIFALIRFAAVDRRTAAGVEALREARRQSDRLRRAPINDETALAVALFGTGVLAGSYLSPFHQMRSSSNNGSDGGSSSSSDSGSGGCGGGGCGGCGG